MNAKIETTEDLLPHNFNTLANEKFKEYARAKDNFINEKEFYTFVNDFFKEEKELCKELSEDKDFYRQSNKSNCQDGINFSEFKELFQDCYIIKNQKDLGGDDNVEFQIDEKDMMY